MATSAWLHETITALQAGAINLADLKKEIYEEAIYENAILNSLNKTGAEATHSPS